MAEFIYVDSSFVCMVCSQDTLPRPNLFHVIIIIIFNRKITCTQIYFVLLSLTWITNCLQIIRWLDLHSNCFLCCSCSVWMVAVSLANDMLRWLTCFVSGESGSECVCVQPSPPPLTICRTVCHCSGSGIV